VRHNIPDIPIDEEKPQNRRIAWWFENTLVRSVLGIINKSQSTMRNILSFSVSDLLETWEDELVSYVEPFASEILNTPNIPDYVKNPIRRALARESQVGGIILIALIGSLVGVMSRGIGNPLGRIVEGRIDSLVRSQKLDWGSLMNLWQRDLISESRLDNSLAVLGLNHETIQALKLGYRKSFDEGLLTQALWRKTLNVEQINTELKRQGFTRTQQLNWHAARRIIPSPTDLVSMAVREAFNDDVARRFGYDDNYPGEAAEWAEKQGLGQEWFKRYWRAHWQLPGITQVREMWRRGIIEQEDVDRFLLAADLPTFWRKAIQKWMSAEITRVDVRRLYALGVISVEDVYRRYRKLGYSEDDAGLMTEWTSAEYLNKERELTKSDILSMFEKGIITSDDTSEYLQALGYRDSDILLLMTRTELKQQEAFESQIISNVQKLYVAGQYDRTDVFARLGELDTPGTFILERLRVWDLLRKSKIRVPSVTQLRDMTQKNIISTQQFRIELESKGYPEHYINWYEQLWFTGD